MCISHSVMKGEQEKPDANKSRQRGDGELVVPRGPIDVLGLYFCSPWSDNKLHRDTLRTKQMLLLNVHWESLNCHLTTDTGIDRLS